MIADKIKNARTIKRKGIADWPTPDKEVFM